MPAKMEKFSKKMKMASPMPMMDMPTRLTINLDKFKGFDEKDIGDKCRAMIEGKVIRIQKDMDYNELVLEITKIEKYDSASSNKSQKSEDNQDGDSE